MKWKAFVMEMTQTVYSARFMRLITQWLLSAGLIVGCGLAPVKTRATADTSQKWATRSFQITRWLGEFGPPKTRRLLVKNSYSKDLRRRSIPLASA